MKLLGIVRFKDKLYMKTHPNTYKHLFQDADALALDNKKILAMFLQTVKTAQFLQSRGCVDAKIQPSSLMLTPDNSILIRVDFQVN